MKSLTIPKFRASIDNKDSSKLIEVLRQIAPLQTVNIINWENYPYKPEVFFRMAYDNRNIYLHYEVKEKYIRALANANNGKVWLDSCVEFFLSPDSNENYYNFEFNCIGTKLLGYKQIGDEIEHAQDNYMDAISCISSLGNQPITEQKGDFNWDLIATIPITSLWKHKIDSLEGKRMTANFYKCGDELTEPHFLSWNNIKTESPSFHQPGFFGELIFQ